MSATEEDVIVAGEGVVDTAAARTLRRIYNFQAIIADDRERDDLLIDLAAGLSGLALLRATVDQIADKNELATALRTTVRETGGEWQPYEIAFDARYVAPRGVGRAQISISPPPPKGFNDPNCDSRAFKPTAVVAGEGCGAAFRLVQVLVGEVPMLPPRDAKEEQRPLNCGPVALEQPAEEVILGVGGVITIFIQNTGKERRSFAGRLIGQQRVRTATP